MNKPITKKNNLYKEAVVWMSYRYAMGMTNYVENSASSHGLVGLSTRNALWRITLNNKYGL